MEKASPITVINTQQTIFLFFLSMVILLPRLSNRYK